MKSVNRTRSRFWNEEDMIPTINVLSIERNGNLHLTFGDIWERDRVMDILIQSCEIGKCTDRKKEKKNGQR